MTEENKEESTYKRLCRLSIPNALVTKKHFLFPNGYNENNDENNIVASEPFNITFEDLKSLKDLVVVRLNNGVVDIYDNSRAEQKRLISGFFESKYGSGLSIGELTSQDTNHKPKDEYLSKNERFIKQL